MGDDLNDPFGWFETGGGEASQVSKLTLEQEQLLRTLTGQIQPGQGVTPYGGRYRRVCRVLVNTTQARD